MQILAGVLYPSGSADLLSPIGHSDAADWTSRQQSACGSPWSVSDGHESSQILSLMCSDTHCPSDSDVARRQLAAVPFPGAETTLDASCRLPREHNHWPSADGSHHAAGVR